MIEALEKLAELNNYDDVLVQTNVGELKAIDFAIDDIRTTQTRRMKFLIWK